MNLAEKKMHLADLIIDIVREVYMPEQEANQGYSAQESAGQHIVNGSEASFNTVGHQSDIPVSQVAPPSAEEIFLFETVAQIVSIMNTPTQSARSSDDRQACLVLYSLLAHPSTYVQFCYVWDRLTEPARQMFRIFYENISKTSPISELGSRMQNYLKL
jgi:hypothetical protein